jgi:hypothetical protein
MPTLKESLKRTRQAVENEITQTILDRPDLTYREIGKLFGVSDAYVAGVAKSRKIQRPAGTASPAWKKRVR